MSRYVSTIFMLTALTLSLSRLMSSAQTQTNVKSSTGIQGGEHDFDFEIGTWKTQLKRLTNPLSGSATWVHYQGTSTVKKVWDGKANLVELVADGSAGHFEGLSLRLYNPESRQWSLNFANIRSGTMAVPSVGEFKNGRGEFYNQDTFQGRPILVRFVISDITANSVHFEQAFSVDSGKTWEVNWIADDTRIDNAQLQVPASSPSATVSTIVGLTDIAISYSRPKMKGRKVFGATRDFLIPYGQMWRTGANDGTFVNFSDDVTVQGINVKKGRYLLYTIPGANKWVIALNSNLETGGNIAGYDKANEVARFAVKSEKTTEKIETFTIDISDVSDDNTNTNIQLAWENTSVKFKVTVDFDSRAMSDIVAKTTVSAGKKIAPGVYGAAANYYLDHGKDLNKALEWINLSLNGNPNAFWNHYAKAKILQGLGDRKGAIAAAQKSLEVATKAEFDYGFIRKNQNLLKELN